MPTGRGSWLLVEELLERGEPAFLDELCNFHDADRLAAFAARWYADRRPASRRLLFDYLNRPLNAFRHEPLVKRLFKLAEKAGDDEVLARFLVLFDRSVRRVRRKRLSHTENLTFDSREAAGSVVHQWELEGAEQVHLNDLGGRFRVWAWPLRDNRMESRPVDTKQEADVLAAQFRREGAGNVNVRDHGGRYMVYGVWYAERIRTPPGTALPRGQEVRGYRNPRTGDQVVVTDIQTRLGLTEFPAGDLESLPRKTRGRIERMRLFSVHTRHYLRRRAWRYFRRMGKEHPERYVPAVTEALKLYEDEDAADGLALIDNWALIHILFHHSPVLVAKSNGWLPAPGRSLAELQPAPICEELWRQAPRYLLDLVKEARCRPVRQWAIRLIRRDAGGILAQLSLEELLGLLTHDDEEVIALAAEALRQAPAVDSIPIERWLQLLDTPNPAALETLCELTAAHVRPERVTLEQAARLAASRPVPLARLGLNWLRGKSPGNEAECRVLLGLVEAQAEPLRAEMVRWARAVLGASPHFQETWVLEYLDSRHPDVRGEGWAWLQGEARARDSVALWRMLLESPYDDVRLQLIADLEKRVARQGTSLSEHVALDPDLVRFLWASVLLNIHRGGRVKPVVVRQLVRRLAHRPEEAQALFPILSVALRSLRGPEWRAGLAGVIQAVEQLPTLAPLLREYFPELKLV